MKMRLVMCGCVLLASAAFAEDPPKPAKKPVETFLDADKAGPDFQIQGEYSGMAPGGISLGAQIIAEGDGNFVIKAFHGGLPGDGFDGDPNHARTVKASLKDGKLSAAVEGAEIVVANGVIQISHGQEKFEIKRVVRKSPSEGAKAPEGATVLFDGKSLEGWTKPDGKSPASWTLLDNGAMQVKGGDVLSQFKTDKPFTLHVEFRLPFMPRARGQGRANSGVYLQNRYELQVLDSFGLAGKNNEAGGFYQAHDPKVNMCFPPLQWQTYDIDFTPAKFDNGAKTANARATVKHNGVVVQDNVELKNASPGGAKEDATPAGFRLQDHGNPVQYRNIWVVETK